MVAIAMIEDQLYTNLEPITIMVGIYSRCLIAANDVVSLTIKPLVCEQKPAHELIIRLKRSCAERLGEIVPEEIVT